MRFYIKLLILSFSVLLLASCGGLAAIRALPPAKMEDFHGGYLELAQCLYDELRLKHSGLTILYDISHRKSQQMAYVSQPFATLFGGRNGEYSWEMSFKRIAENSTETVLRSRKTVWGGYQAQEFVFEIISGCESEDKNRSD